MNELLPIIFSFSSLLPIPPVTQITLDLISSILFNIQRLHWITALPDKGEGGDHSHGEHEDSMRSDDVIDHVATGHQRSS